MSTLPDPKKKNKKPRIKPEDEMPVLTPELRLAAEELIKEGMEPADAEKFSIYSEKSLRDASSNIAVFPLKAWEAKFKKIDEPVYEHWVAHPKWGQFRSIVARHIGLQPLSKSGLDTPWALYTTERLQKLEAEILKLAKRETTDHHVPPELLEIAFASRPTMAEEQKLATVACTSGNKAVMVTEGTAGAGKSFTLNAIREIYENCPGRTANEAMGYDIIGTALSWTATKVLEASAGLSGGKAIEGLTRAMDLAHEKGEDFFKRRTILIVDEAGLVGLGHMYKILWHSAHSKYPVRVILTGDSLQLNPVMAGNALEAIVDECGSARLDTIRRQKQDSHRRAVKHFCFGRAENAMWTYWQQEAIHFCPDNESRREKVMRDYVRYVVSNPQKTALVLALENKEVKTLNEEIRKRLKSVGRLVGKEVPIKVTDGKSVFTTHFSAGDQIVLRKNSIEHPVFKSKFKKVFEGLAAAELESKKHLAAGTSSLPFLKKGSDLFSIFRKMLGSLSKKSPSGSSTPKGSVPHNPDDEEDRKGVFNRMAGIILNIKKHPTEKDHFIIRILLAEGGETDIDTSTYRDDEADAVPLNHNFATTIYASQGQTVERVFMIDSPYMNRRLAYVGMSRHTELCDIYLNCSELAERMKNERALRHDGAARAVKKAEGALLSATEPQATDAAERKLIQLRHELSEWEPKYAHEIKPSEYLRIAAFTWNKDSANPTPGMAAKHMNERRSKSVKQGADAWLPEKHPDDNPEDNHLTGNPAHDPNLRHDEPPEFEFLAKQYASSLIEKPKKEAELELFAQKGPQTDGTLEQRELPEWCSEPYAQKSLAELQKRSWDINRYGYARLFSIDPLDGHAVSRWGFDGALKAGDGSIPVLTNEAHFRDAPWLIVQNTRQALIAWSFYREKHSTTPHIVPNIGCAYPAADLDGLRKWFTPGTKAVWCAWTPKDPSSLQKAKELVERLNALGHKATIYPREPSAIIQNTTGALKASV